MSDETVHQTPYGDNLLDIEVPSSRRIRTLEQLLQAGQVDTAVWETTNFTLNKWEVAAKASDGESMMVEELFQVKASLRRKKLISGLPILQPLMVNRTIRRHKNSRRKNHDGVEITLIATDPHFGFVRNQQTGEMRSMHDMQALDTVIQVAYDLRPHKIVIGGDILDLAEWSDKFVRSPDLEQMTQPAVIAAHWWLAHLAEASPGSARLLLQGNHDLRIENAILNHLKSAYDLRPADELTLPPALSIPRLLALKKIGYDYIGDYPNGQHYVNDDFVIEHGSLARKGGGKTVQAVINNYDTNVLFGHIHRLELAQRTIHTNGPVRTIGAYSAGCLCRIDGTVPGRSARPDWQQGFAVSYHNQFQTQIQLYEIVNGRCLFGGKMYRGEDRTAVLEADTGRRFI